MSYVPPHRRGSASSASTVPSTSAPATAITTAQTTPVSSLPAKPASSLSAPTASRAAAQTKRDLSLPSTTASRPQTHRFTSSPVPNANAGRTPVQRSSPAQPQRRFSPAPSEMELLASVARSGGDGAEGDALKDYATQERFRAYIDEKIHAYHHVEDEGAVKNIVRLFRKLREGIVASGRLDKFAIEAFESSVRYAVIAHDAPQLISALSGLVPELYLKVDDAMEERKLAGITEECVERIAKMDLLRSTYRDDVEGKWADRHAQGHDTAQSHHHSYGDDHSHAHSEEKDNRSHFASLLLLYHLVHSPRGVFNSTFESLVAPRIRRLGQRDYAGIGDDDGEPSPKPIDPPSSQMRPFTTPGRLMYARAAARALAAEPFDPVRFGKLVAGEGRHPTAAHDHPEALERALLAWASPRVRTLAADRLRKAYISAPTDWVATYLNLNGGESGVLLWALASGLTVKDGSVNLRP